MQPGADTHDLGARGAHAATIARQLGAIVVELSAGRSVDPPTLPRALEPARLRGSRASSEQSHSCDHMLTCCPHD